MDVQERIQGNDKLATPAAANFICNIHGPLGLMK